jgi:hypothetical protein
MTTENYEGEELSEANLDELTRQAAEEGADIGDEELEIDLSDAVDLSPFAGKDVPVEVVKAVKTPSKSTPGNTYIKLHLRVFEGEFKGRYIFDNVNLKGKGAGFARSSLDALGAGIDWDAPRIRPSKLVGLRALVKTAIDVQEDYADKTVVKGWKPYRSDSASAFGQAQ